MDEHNSCIFLQFFFHARSLRPLWTVAHSHFYANRFHHNDIYIVIWWRGHNEISILWFLFVASRTPLLRLYILPVTTCYNSIYIFTGQLKGFTKHLWRINYISLSNCFSFLFPFDSSMFFGNAIWCMLFFFRFNVVFSSFYSFDPSSSIDQINSWEQFHIRFYLIDAPIDWLNLHILYPSSRLNILHFRKFDCFHRWFFISSMQ